ncbi:hypothetical protein [Xenorhabdus anantnagensis]|uniref:CdiI immunity protein domain-containing protein n=1 Tax=Xenorhabdus anantnagensis TaxID=3025875 RepID=A0ABT5LUJ5_9GAMM|nr:hypothetical protein [Xenorhabdus anantnagensis]MDC9598091.1 hypothetical protein [Xenorhabdus anantnagensis]
MNNGFYLRLDSLSKELGDVYTKRYSSENEEYLENKKIKSRLIDLILEAEEYDKKQFFDNALFLLFDNTECQEDFEILNEIILPLLDKKLLPRS